jgi:hypothetical protein
MKLLSRLFFQQKFMLGRWFIHYDQKIIDKKIDQANEDHCGCCNYNTNKIDDEEYYKPFLI